MVILFLVFLGTSSLLPIVAALTYIPTNSVGDFSFLHTLSHICFLSTVQWWPFWLVGGGISLSFWFVKQVCVFHHRGWGLRFIPAPSFACLSFLLSRELCEPGPVWLTRVSSMPSTCRCLMTIYEYVNKWTVCGWENGPTPVCQWWLWEITSHQQKQRIRLRGPSGGRFCRFLWKVKGFPCWLRG